MIPPAEDLVLYAVIFPRRDRSGDQTKVNILIALNDLSADNGLIKWDSTNHILRQKKLGQFRRRSANNL